MIIIRTPYRLSFFGGGTDYNSWFEEHGGLVLATAMARYCYLTLRYLPPFFEHRSRIVYGKIEEVTDRREIQHPAARGCLEHLDITDGVEIHHDGDLPARSGIGSSSSFTVGLLHGLHALRGRMANPEQLARAAIEVEQQRLKEAVGIQDQIMAAYGGFRTIEMGVGSTWQVKPLIVSRDYLQALEAHVLLGFSGVSRLADRHARSQVQNIQSGKSETRLREIQAVTQEALSLFSHQANLEEIGKLLDQSWRIKRTLAEDVSNSSIDELYGIGKRTGAFGGKLMGAGGGGFFFFLAPPYRHQAIKEALPQIKVWVPFQIDFGGSQVIFHNS